MKQKLVLLDNLDSFTYNLVQLLYCFSTDILVYRNNNIAVEDLMSLKPDAIILSPGPGRPNMAGIMPRLISAAVAKAVPLLGVCLGHQAIAESFGAKIILAKEIRHGKVSFIQHQKSAFFYNIPNNFKAVQYNSLVVDEASVPQELEIICRSVEDGEIMGLQHRCLPIVGVQYHPESILSEYGFCQFNNFFTKVIK